MMELGSMRAARKSDQPVIVLEREGTANQVDGLAGFIRIPYPAATGKYAIREITEALREEFLKKNDIQKLNGTEHAHYLSPLLLNNKFQIDRQTAENLAYAYVTMEKFVNADVKDIRR